MREILFKAKGQTSDKWNEGLLTRLDKDVCHIKDNKHNEWICDSSTICQYTGLTDKVGRKIFEGDILKGFQYPFLSGAEFNYFTEVCWLENVKSLGLYTIKNPKSDVRGISEGNTEIFEDFNSNDWEVIGNIYDNPELLEETED